MPSTKLKFEKQAARWREKSLQIEGRRDADLVAGDLCLPEALTRTLGEMRQKKVGPT